MSAVDSSCYVVPPERESGAGEMNCYKSVSGDGSSISHIIATEIMNDILDNTFDIVMARSIQQVPKVDKISPNVVGDILENILSQSPNSNNQPYGQDETALLDDEIKRIIKEMKYPPEQKSIVCTQGVGDQLSDKSELAPDKVLSGTVKRNTLERKNRLTNLVRNSKQMLAKLVNNDNEHEVKVVKSEEINERVIKVVDLETIESKSFTQAGCSTAEPEILPAPPSEYMMDMVDLEPNLHRQDEKDIEVDEKDTDVEEKDGCCSLTKTDAKKGVNMNKKKWNFGAKIMRYIRRQPKKE